MISFEQCCIGSIALVRDFKCLTIFHHLSLSLPLCLAFSSALTWTGEIFLAFKLRMMVCHESDFQIDLNLAINSLSVLYHFGEVVGKQRFRSLSNRNSLSESSDSPSEFKHLLIQKINRRKSYVPHTLAWREKKSFKKKSLPAMVTSAVQQQFVCDRQRAVLVAWQHKRY